MGIGIAGLYRNRIAAEERAIGLPLTVLREALDASTGLMTRLALAQPLFNAAGSLSPLLVHAARITALRLESCDECVGIGIAYARRDGLGDAVLWCLARGQVDGLPPEAARVVRFVEAVLAASPEADALGQEIERAHGRRARLELLLAACTARLFPVVKRGLGLSTACAVPLPHAAE
ncbi:MAG: hypothetical protein VYB54_05625 [Pseudomonadota bacterium]|nr:hypothetical protein [Pseudomonadota bacterium]